jgi:RNA polymerase sigma-70 factor (sigma-E family)
VTDSIEAQFRDWVTSERDGLRTTAYMLCSDWHLADDLVQEALTRLFVVWARVNRSGDPKGYARRILVNLYIDHRRRPSRREEPTAAPPEPAPREDVHSMDGIRSDVIAALGDVPPGQRAVLVLRFWDDLSVEHTARLLDTSIGNVKSQSSRGLTALRAALLARGLTDLHSSLTEMT